ncbi:YolD-like family protein [Paenibacillus sp. NAIST15-1]|uniref:YolD-like family protein n=1 Tax=Paenibacillus sp. NAIST15-1 TaxID=1605994 RepID=UPI0008698348|nr:YolD-like family protein [Paenibacillus sp. NAIST15-1]GAV13217.1 YolD-like protein [Paenibacillus sp. NAIST15-1]
MSKLNGNGIFEGSRFILPEHREALLEQQHERNRQQRPTLDEQECEQIEALLQQSMSERGTITLQMYDPFEQCQLTAQVIDLDPQGRRVKLLLDGEKQWIKMDDILEVRA